MRRSTLGLAALVCAACLLPVATSQGAQISVTAKAGDRTQGYVDVHTSTVLGAAVTAEYDSPTGLPYEIHSDSLAASGTDSLGLSIFKLAAFADYAGPDNEEASQSYSELLVNDELTVTLGDVGPTVNAILRIQIDGVLGNRSHPGIGLSLN